MTNDVRRYGEVGKGWYAEWLLMIYGRELIALLSGHSGITSLTMDTPARTIRASQTEDTMNVGELKRHLANIDDDVDVLVMAEDETLNGAVFEDHTDPDDGPGSRFIVLALPETYDTYIGKKTRG